MRDDRGGDSICQVTGFECAWRETEVVCRIGRGDYGPTKDDQQTGAERGKIRHGGFFLEKNHFSSS